MDWRGGVISLPCRNLGGTSQLMKYHRNNLSPSSGRGLWRYLPIHPGYPHWLGLSDLMMLSLTSRRRNESVHRVCVKAEAESIFINALTATEIWTHSELFSSTNMSKWTHRWLVYMLLICFLMHPSIFYNRFMNGCGICLTAFVYVEVCYAFHGNWAQWREEGSFASLKWPFYLQSHAINVISLPMEPISSVSAPWEF